MATAGYSGTPLARKLGLKDGQRVLFVDLPDSLAELAEAHAFAAVERIGIAGAGAAAGGHDLVHVFTASRTALESVLEPLGRAIARDGTIWVSWPKKAARVATDLTEDVVRAIALPLGLVDVKVCAVDEVWSGLKLVIRRELR